MPHDRESEDKILTPLNWLELDEPTKKMQLVCGQSDIEDFATTLLVRLLSIQISHMVPPEIKEMFRNTCGLAAYGAFFYPIYMKAMEESTRVMEAAARYKALDLGLQIKKGKNGDRPPSFHECLRYLKGRGVLDDDLWARWDATRELRNMGSHPAKRSLMDPGQCIGMLKDTADMISDLFAGRQ